MMLNRNQKVERILLLEERDRRSVLKKAGIERERIHRNASDIKDRCRSLAGFIREAWHTIEPSTPYVHGWHIDSLCVPYETSIETESGPMLIGEIIDSGWDGRVLSANHTTGSLEWRTILRRMKTPTGHLFAINTGNGIGFKATGNHPVFVIGKGYVRADTITIGDRIVEMQPLQGAVQTESIHEGNVLLSEMPLRLPKGDDASRVRVGLSALRKTVSSLTSARSWRVLFDGLFWPVEVEAGNQSLSYMRWSEVVGRQPVQVVPQQKPNRRFRNTMRLLQKNGLSNTVPYESIVACARRFLQSRLSCRVRGWAEQCRVCRWAQSRNLWSWVQVGKGKGAGKGRRKVFSVRHRLATGCPPYRSGSQKQQVDQSCDSLQAVPREGTQASTSIHHQAVEGVVVSVEREVRLLGSLYNLEVEGNNNYFANGVLLHNCDHLEAVSAGRITRLLINIPPGTMKALDHDCPIWTLNGWKRHGDLQPGDYVFGPDGLPKIVEACTPDVLEDAYEVRFDTGSTIVAGSGHEWLVEREFSDKESKWKRERRERLVTTPELFSRESVCGTFERPDRIPTTDAMFGVDRDLLIDPYVLGAWLGDGASHTGSIYASEQDYQHFEKVFGATATQTREASDRGQAFYRITVPGLSTRLRVLGLLGNKHIPDEYLKGSIEQRLQLLRGLMDTDGHATKQGECLFTNKNRRLVEGAHFLAASLGCKPTTAERRSVLYGHDYGPYWQVHFRPADGRNPFLLERKSERAKEAKQERYKSRFIKSVQPVGKRVVKCIQVDGGMYLAGKDLIPTHNSLAISVFWPAWEWGPSGQSSMRYLTTSYSDHYAKRDARRMRDLIESPWYQELWGDEVKLVRAGEKSFSNTGFGWREAMPFASLTAGRGDRVIVDDPHSTEKAESEVDREKITRLFRESLPTRLNSPEHSAIVVIMQRLNEADMSGVILAGDYGYVYLMLPMEFEPERRCYTKIKPTHFKSVELEARFDPQSACWYVDGEDIPEEQESRIKALPLQSVYNQDPRTVDGELLFEKRFPRWVVDRDTKIMGTYASAGQMQQRPSPRGGGMFQKKDFEIVAAAPAGCRWVRGWDLAGSDVEPGKNPAYTAGVLMGKSPDGTFYIQDMTRIQGTAGKVDKLLKNTATQDDASFHGVMGSIPQDPGSAGKDRAKYLIKHLAGHNYRKSPESGDKVTRAESMSAQAEAGNIKIVKGDWNKEFLDEITVFPVGKFKDQVDAATRAFNILTDDKKKKISVIGGEIFT